MVDQLSPRRGSADAGFELSGRPASLRLLLRNSWRQRKLIGLLARRDIHVRYRRPVFGLVWVLAVPIVHAAALSVVFSFILPLPTEGVPRPVFMLSGLLPWMLFSAALNAGVVSITGGVGLASKAYFPRAFLPLVAVRSSLFGYIPRLIIVIGVALVFGVGIGPSIVWLLPATGLMVALAASFALVLAVMNVYFRDMSFIVQVATQVWFYGSGVFFPVSVVPEGPIRTAVELNPATGMVNLFRAAVVGWSPEWAWVWPSLVWSAVLSIAAMWLYRRYDRVLIDLQ